MKLNKNTNKLGVSLKMFPPPKQVPFSGTVRNNSRY